LDWDYKNEHASDHVAKFCSDRQRDLGDFALKKNKQECRNCSKHKAFWELLFRAGSVRPNYNNFFKKQVLDSSSNLKTLAR